METSIDKKHLYTYLGFAFGIAWIVALIIYFTGGLEKSPEVVAGTKITLAIILVALGYMWAPAVAHILTRLVTKQGWSELRLSPNFSNGKLYWLLTWFGPGILSILGIAVFYLVFPGLYDGNLSYLRNLLAANPAGKSIDPWMIVLTQTLSALIVSPIINGLFTFGEEFGWRAYMLPLLMPLGEKKAYLVSGVIWGLWHAPIIAMGHNFGLDYPGFPWLGILVMIWFCVLSGTFLGWASHRAGSVWPAVIGHAAINGIAGLGLLFISAEKINPLFGPTSVGLLGSTGFLVAALLIYFYPRKNTIQPEQI